MFDAITIRNFRGFDELRVEGLTRVNLIVGDNGTGKTSLLEALFLLAGRSNPHLALVADRARNVPLLEADTRRAFEALFPGFDTHLSPVVEGYETSPDDEEAVQQSLTMRLVSADGQDVPIGVLTANGRQGSDAQSNMPLGGERLQMEWQFADQPPVVRDARMVGRILGDMTELTLRVEPAYVPEGPASVFISSGISMAYEIQSSRFTAIRKAGQREAMVAFLGAVDDRVRNLELLSWHGEMVLHADVGTVPDESGRVLEQWFPIVLMGGGLVRTASIYLAAKGAERGLLLIDEVDAGLHYTALAEGFWQGVFQTARDFDLQVFATTHSHECMAAAYEAFDGENAKDLSVHRLERVDGKVQAISFDHRILGLALRGGSEVR